MEVNPESELEPSQYLLEAEGEVIRDNLPLNIVSRKERTEAGSSAHACSKKLR